MAEHRLKLQIAIELAQSFLWYSDISTAGPIIDAIREFVGLEVEFDGVLGKRTRYQQDAKSQLVVRIKRREECCKFDDFEPLLRSLEARAEKLDSPKNVSLDDDTLLDQVQFHSLPAPSLPLSSLPVDSERVQSHSLSSLPVDSECLFPEEECYLLLLISQLKRTVSTGDEIGREELGTFINYMIQKTHVWSVRLKSLYLRSLSESNSSRRIQRSMMQLETLVEFTRDDTDRLFDTRFLYTSFFDPSWVIEKHLADTLRSMGCVKASLDIYERLGYWEDVIFCYHM